MRPGVPPPAFRTRVWCRGVRRYGPAADVDDAVRARYRGRGRRCVRASRALAIRLLGAGIELAFRAIPRALGQHIGPTDAWLFGPIGPDGPVGSGYYAALARDQGLVLVADDP